MDNTRPVVDLVYVEREKRFAKDRTVQSLLRKIDQQRDFIEQAWTGFKIEKAKSLAAINALEKRIRARQKELTDEVWKDLRRESHIAPITAGFTPAPPEPRLISVTIPPDSIQAHT